MTQVQYTLEVLLPYVRRIQLRSTFDFRIFAEQVWAQLQKAGMPGVLSASQLEQAYGRYDAASGRAFQYAAIPWDLKNATTEAWFYMFRNGYMVPAPPDDYLQAPNLSRLNFTQRGLAWVDGKEPFPEDANGYMTFLRGLVPVALDKVTEQYVTESLVAFNREAYFAAAVMLGAASEKAIYLLAESLLDAFIDVKRRERLEALLKRRKLGDLLDSVGELIRNASNASIIPYEVSEGSEPHLLSLFDAMRVQRNDAVHPMNATVSADSVRMTILAFPHALAKAGGIAVVVPRTSQKPLRLTSASRNKRPEMLKEKNRRIFRNFRVGGHPGRTTESLPKSRLLDTYPKLGKCIGDDA